MHHEVYTADEKAFVLKTQGLVSDGHWLCKPCLKVLRDPVQGAQLIKGTLQINLSAGGVGNAEHVAQKFHDKLVDLTVKKPIS
jgi:hypothetical protein